MLPELREDEIDGVRTFWVDTGRPTLGAVLVFRTGMVDETLPTTGWSHLVEHLALHGRGTGTLSVNGSTALLHTQVQAHGAHGDVAAFLRDVTTWLAAPDLGRLGHESRVLRAEAEYRGQGDGTAALLQRYGARGPGLVGYAEPGLARAAEGPLRELLGTSFTAGNAVLVLDGPPPEGLRLALGPGAPVPVPDLPTTTEARPAAYVTAGRLVLSGEVPRTVPATFLPQVVEDMLRRDLRDAAGGAYAPWGTYEAVGPDTGVVLAGSDVARSLHPTVVHYALSGLAALRERGPIAGVVEDAVAAAVRGLRDPYQATGFAYRAAVAHLRGEPPQSPEAVVEEVAAVTRDDVHAVVAGFGDSLLLGVPGDAAWNHELRMLRMGERQQRPGGTRYRTRNAPAVHEDLVVGEEGLAVGSGERWRTVEVGDVAGVLAFPDGGRHVIRRDGWGISVEPTMWRRGRAAVTRVDECLPSGLVMVLDARDPSVLPRPASAWRRWLPAWWIVLGLVLFTALLLLGIGTAEPFTVVVAAGAIALYLLVLRQGWAARSS